MPSSELGRLAPEHGEEENAASLARLHAGAARGSGDEPARSTALARSGSEGGAQLRAQAARRLDRIAAEHAPCSLTLAALDRAAIEAVRSRGCTLAPRRRARSTFDPARLEEAEERLFEICAASPASIGRAAALPALQERAGGAGSRAIEAGGEQECGLAGATADARAAL